MEQKYYYVKEIVDLQFRYEYKEGSNNPYRYIFETFGGKKLFLATTIKYNISHESRRCQAIVYDNGLWTIVGFFNTPINMYSEFNPQ
jgi:hypothetical protein